MDNTINKPSINQQLAFIDVQIQNGKEYLEIIQGMDELEESYEETEFELQCLYAIKENVIAVRNMQIADSKEVHHG